ncbi:DUF427-domain-containing protein isoform A [Micractinium conductrix]|uniref:DUF427-domain-containing protein isoform A n=1 Tax=Micractinium conductrix TaxID=554055 RepID=A0A2P6VKB7_9CHLO|nr:DUF427-domain-containing protein isoform A [Micractinium conductrix]|eukprot:PSC74539.1 DUF427-domain-containing protein isoform A [Micractinium conductrix]
MLGGFKTVSDHANDAGVAAAQGAVAEALAGKLGAPPSLVEVLSAQTQVVAGINYKLTLKVDAAAKGVHYYEAKVWQRLPHEGGKLEVTTLNELSPEQARACTGQAAEPAAGGADEFTQNPEVDDAAGYAVQQLSEQSNSLFPYTLKRGLGVACVHALEGEPRLRSTPPGCRLPPVVRSAWRSALLAVAQGCGKVLSSRVHKTSSGVSHVMRLQLSHGSMPDQVYEVEVENPGGAYQLKNSRQVMTECNRPHCRGVIRLTQQAGGRVDGGSSCGGGGAQKKESAAAYPRPPALEKTSRRLRVLLGGQVVADSTDAYRVLETHHPPAYYLPPRDVDTSLLTRSQGGATFCEWKGSATYWDVTAGGQTAKRRVWSYEAPTEPFKPITGYLSFYATPFECWVDEERVQPQEGSFYGGWVSSDVEGPFKGGPGTAGW